MPTITNRNRLSRGYIRDRENVSRKMRTEHLGKMTQEQFHMKVEEVATANFYVRVCYLRNTAVLSRDNADKTMKRFSYEPINYIVATKATPFFNPIA